MIPDGEIVDACASLFQTERRATAEREPLGTLPCGSIREYSRRFGRGDVRNLGHSLPTHATRFSRSVLLRQPPHHVNQPDHSSMSQN
jgi:hypothetical protein